MFLLEVIKAFISGIFAGMANDHAKRGDSQGASWRARHALRWASNPLTQVFAHAANAKADVLGKNRGEAKRHVETALGLIHSTTEIQAFPEVRVVRSELEAMQRELV